MEKFNEGFEDFSNKLSTPARFGGIDKPTTYERMEGDPGTFAPESEFAEIDLDNGTIVKEVFGKAPSMEVQAMEIRDYFIEQPELQYENWKDLSVEARVEALSGLENQMAEIAKRPPAAIVTQLSDLDETDMRTDRLMGVGKDISFLYIDGDSLGDNSFEAYQTTMTSMFYKGRHLYQSHNVYGRTVESNDALIEAWDENLNGYVGYRMLADGAQESFEFRQQPVEIDAYQFVDSVLNKLDLRA